MRGYKTSKDYKRLKELLDNGYEVIVIAGGYAPGIQPTLGIGRKSAEYYVLGTILTWAESYIEGCGWDWEPYCQINKVEFIEPEL